MLRTVLTKLHWIIGITAGIVLAIVGFTGGILAFQDEILDAINSDIVHVQPDGPLTAPAYLMKKIQNDYPDKRIQSFTISSNPNDAARVMFAPARPQGQGGGLGGGNGGGFGGARPQFGGDNGGGNGERPQQQGAGGVGGNGARPAGGRGEMRYVNPYTGELLPPAKGRQFFQTVENIHRRLLADKVGNQIVAACTVCLLILVFSGLYLRWPRELTNWRIWLTFDFTKQGRFFLRGIHLVLGTWVLLFYLLSGATGMLMSYDGLRNGLYDLTGTPRPQGLGPPPGGAPGAQRGQAAGQMPANGNAGMQGTTGGPPPGMMAMGGEPPANMMNRDGAPNAGMPPRDNSGENSERPRRRDGAEGDNASFARDGGGERPRQREGANDNAGFARGEGGNNGGGKPAFDAFAAWDAFEQAVPNYSTVTLRIPAPGQPIQFTYMDPVPQNKRAFNRLTLDPVTLAVKQNDRYADKTLAGKLLGSLFPLHSGDFFGWPVTVLIMLASFAMPFFTITGWMMYLQRRRSKTA